MNTSVPERMRDYRRPSDEYWKHPTMETLYDIALRHGDGQDVAAETVRGAGHPYTGVEWIQPYDKTFNMVFIRGPKGLSIPDTCGSNLTRASRPTSGISWCAALSCLPRNRLRESTGGSPANTNAPGK